MLSCSIFTFSGWLVVIILFLGLDTLDFGVKLDVCTLSWKLQCSKVYLTHLQYKVLLYSLDGRLLSSYSAYEWSLGIKSVVWSPSSQFLAVGSYDEKACTQT